MRQAFRRVSVPSNSVQRSRPLTFPAPTRGLVLTENAAAARAGGASVLDNWFPTQTGIRLRGGCRKVATIGAGPVSSMFTYVAGNSREMFAASLTSVFQVNDLTDATTPPAAEFSGQTNGYYSSQQISTAGGTFLYIVNGYDKPRLYNGATWTAIDSASTPALTPPSTPGTSLDTKRFSHVWSFKNRLFFVERGSMNAWCLPVDSIGGTLTQISLAGVFQILDDLKAGTAGVVCLALGLLAGGGVVLAYDAWIAIPAAETAARKAGAADERAAWQKLLDDAKAVAEEARRNAEIKIADAERDYLSRDAARAAQMTALEQALEQEQADAPIPLPADRDCVCRPAISRGVRDALQGLGRAGPGPHPAKPDAALRPSR